MSKYLDIYHTELMAKCRKAFEAFNDALADADPVGMAWVPEATVQFDDEKYCRVFFEDGEIFVEPIYNPIRDINDR